MLWPWRASASASQPHGAPTSQPWPQDCLCVVWKRIKRRVKPQFCLVQVQVGGVGPVFRRAFVTPDLGLACPLHQLSNGLVPPVLLHRAIKIGRQEPKAIPVPSPFQRNSWGGGGGGTLRGGGLDSTDGITRKTTKRANKGKPNNKEKSKAHKQPREYTNGYLVTPPFPDTAQSPHTAPSAPQRVACTTLGCTCMFDGFAGTPEVQPCA